MWYKTVVLVSLVEQNQKGWCLKKVLIMELVRISEYVYMDFFSFFWNEESAPDL